jgi:3-hydroxyacyl-CoA dehydrogenase
MTKDIKVVTVIGAGAMGGAIAAQLSNAGIFVNLLNIDEKDKKTGEIIPGDVVARNRIEQMQKAKLNTDPLNAAFMDPANARFVNPGRQQDNLAEAVANSDWVIEVIVERPEIKQALFAEIEKHRRPDTIVSSNTSTIPLSVLIEGRSDNFKQNFANTHFFNPPHIMRLLEIVRGPDTTDEVAETLRDFCDRKMGKDVRFCNDTPGMMANRIGVYLLFRAIAEAYEKNMPIEDVDAALGKPMGFPKDGIFGLLDLVGIGLVPELTKNFLSTLPENDAFRRIEGQEALALAHSMIEQGNTGRVPTSKYGWGFYRRLKQEDGTKIPQSLDLQTGQYRASEKPNASYLGKVAAKDGVRAFFDLAETISPAKVEAERVKLVAGDAKANAKLDAKLDAQRLSEFSWPVMRDTLLYAVSLVPSVTNNIDDIDQSMRAGYNWKRGPFQLLDDIGHDWFIKRLQADGIAVPPILQLAGDEPFYRIIDGKQNHRTFDFAAGTTGYEANFQPEGVLNLQDIKRTSKPLITHNSASLWDIGNGVVCMEIHSKMNAMDPSALYVINESIKLINNSGGKYKSMVVYQGDDRFLNEGGEFARDDDNFSVGANLSLIDTKYELALHKYKMYVDMGLKGRLHDVFKPLAEKWDDRQREKRLAEFYNEAADLIYYGQSVYKALRDAPFPVVGAASGMAFGGGCELLLYCNTVQTTPVFIAGLVEAGVGVIPAWGGTTRVLAKAQDAQKAGLLPKGEFVASRKAFEVISMPQFSMAFTAPEAKQKGWLSPGDGISVNRARLLSDAKEKALSMAPDFTSPKPTTFFLAGESAATAFRSAVDDFDTKGMLTHHDVVVADAQGHVVSGGDTNPSNPLSESDLMQLEREDFISLLKHEDTIARIKYMLKNGKPLREDPPAQPLSTQELRETRENIKLPFREVTGQPLTGIDADKLKKQADAVTKFYDQGRKLGLL